MVRLIRRNVFTAALILFVAVLGSLFEDQKQYFPWLVTLQSKAFVLLEHLEARQPRATHTALIVIDDDTHFKLLGDPSITDRRFLARIVRNAARAGAAVVALDINVRVDPNETALHGPADAALVGSFRVIGDASPSVPAVVTTGFVAGSNPPQEEANFVPDGAWPPNVSVGFDEGPAADPRELPLALSGKDVAGTWREFHSFSLQIADAYDAALHIAPPVSRTPRLERAIDEREFVDGTFLPADAFPEVSAAAVARGDRAALTIVAHRVAIVGGAFHEAYKSDNWVDRHDTPLGPMQGVEVHANYVEALLDDRTKVPLPAPVAFAIDLLLGIGMVAIFRRARSSLGRAWLLALVFVPLAFSYVAFVNFSYSLDFALPLVLLGLHFGLDVYRKLPPEREPPHPLATAPATTEDVPATGGDKAAPAVSGELPDRPNEEASRVP
jgi:CHASE2 domain-containing sensor protein